MLKIKEGTKFRRDYKRIIKRGKDRKKLQDIIIKLAKQEPLEIKHKPHPLTGNWKPCWDCHVEPDWLLIYRVTDNEVILYRTGSHADLFKK